MPGGLTAEQLKRIEENRKRALAKRAEKSKHQSALPHIQNNNNNIQNKFETYKNKSSTSLEVNTSKTGESNNKTGMVVSQVDGRQTDKNAVQHRNTNIAVPSHIDSRQTDRDVVRSEKTLPVHSVSTDTTHFDNISNQDRMEQNRLKALAKRAEKKAVNCLQKNYSSSVSSHKPSTMTAGSFLIANINKDSISALNAQSKWSGSMATNGTNSSNISSSSSTPMSSEQHSKNFSSDSTSSAKAHSMVSDKPQSGWNAFESVGKGTVKGKCVLVSRDRFCVEIGYSSPLIQFFKTMQTKLYDAVTKKWSFRLIEYNKFVNSVKVLKPAVEIEPLPKAILQAFDAQVKGGNPVRTIPIADLSRVEPNLINSLMSFQREGVNYGVYKNGRVLIADDMGLGKTIQAICLACYYRLEWPLLVVVPSSVRFDWAQQLQRWVPSLDPQSINVAVSGKDSCVSGLVNIISYDLMSRKADALKAKKFQVIIMDECHLLKNYKTARCKAAMPLLQGAKRVIMLSGTPALSRPSELYTQISAICPFLFKYHDFGVRYCDGKQQHWGWDFSGSSNMEELQLLLEEKIMIRRLKKDVLSELPDKLRQMVQLDPSFIKVDKGLQNASKIMGKLKKTEERGALLDFFHKSGIAKIKAIKNYVIDLLDGEKKFIIFAHHGDVLDEIESTVQSKIDSNYIRIDGKTGSEQRNFFCKRFQHNDSTRVAILSITAANAGLNLSAANLVVFAELFWNPGILVQAEDRAHRIGQQDSVSVHYLVATGTSDDHIWPMIQKKLDVLGKAGLTKDNFSSAETTKFLDQQQEKLTKFLEESFSTDAEYLNSTEQGEESKEDAKSSMPKQQSILKYTSPMKLLPNPVTKCSNTPSKNKCQNNLFKYFSPSKASSSKSDQVQGRCQGQFEVKVEGQLEDEFIDDDFDELLSDSDLDLGIPPNKKMKTEPSL